MRDDEYPTPLSDPEAEGLPQTADDDSTANDDVLTGREADGPEPAQLPGDRTPVAVDSFGTTAEEQLDGESLDYKLQREQYERPADDPLAGRSTRTSPPRRTATRPPPRRSWTPT